MTLRNALLGAVCPIKIFKGQIRLELHFLLFGQTVWHLPCNSGIKQKINKSEKCSYWVGDTAQNSKTEDWGAGWLAGSLSDYSANTGSILQAETCEFLS